MVNNYERWKGCHLCWNIYKATWRKNKRTYFDKFLTENENNIKSVKIEVVKELKRNFKDMKTQLEKRETRLIIKDKLENAFNLNTKIDKRFA